MENTKYDKEMDEHRKENHRGKYPSHQNSSGVGIIMYDDNYYVL